MKRPHLFIIGAIIFIAAVVSFAPLLYCQTQTAYFLVAIPALYQLGVGDSYVLPLSASEDIAFVRTLIAAGCFKIATSKLAAGAVGINRDMLAQGMPVWS